MVLVLGLAHSLRRDIVMTGLGLMRAMDIMDSRGAGKEKIRRTSYRTIIRIRDRTGIL